jgi:hypothetical protein
MSVIWLFVWLINGVPALHQWNAWAVSLAVCLAIDVLDMFAAD